MPDSKKSGIFLFYSLDFIVIGMVTIFVWCIFLALGSFFTYL